MKPILFTTLLIGSLAASECVAQNGFTRSGNYWVPNQMIAPMPAQARQQYYPNYGRPQGRNSYGNRPMVNRRLPVPAFGMRSRNLPLSDARTIGSADTFGATTTYRDRFGKTVGTADRFGGTTTFRNQHGLQVGTADRFGGTTTYRNRFGQQTGTADSFEGATTFRDQYGRSTGSADRFGGTTTYRDQYGRSLGTSDSFGGTTTFRDPYGQTGITADR